MENVKNQSWFWNLSQHSMQINSWPQKLNVSVPLLEVVPGFNLYVQAEYFLNILFILQG